MHEKREKKFNTLLCFKDLRIIFFTELGRLNTAEMLMLVLSTVRNTIMNKCNTNLQLSIIHLVHYRLTHRYKHKFILTDCEKNR